VRPAGTPIFFFRSWRCSHPPSHATSQPQLFYYYIHIYLRSHHKSTHSLSIPAIFRFHFTSFGNTTYCIYPPYITALSSSPPSPGTLTKHTPRDSIFPEFRFRHEAISSRIGQFPLYNRSRLAYCTQRTCQTVGIQFKRTLLPPISWGIGFLVCPCGMVGERKKSSLALVEDHELSC
jgi:hypothetical protein